MSSKRQVTCIVLMAYLFGFFAGCMVLGYLSGQIPAGPVEKGKGNVHGKQMAAKAVKASFDTPANLSEPELVEFTGEVHPGDEASIFLRTLPGRVCTIRYINPANQEEELPTSFYQITGEDGRCGWRWKISPQHSPNSTGTLYVFVGGKTKKFFFTIR